MSPVSRYPGWRMWPEFVPNGPTHPVWLAFDGSHLTLWIGEPPTVWQTPVSELRQMELRVGQRLRFSATVSGVRYHWTTKRRPEHDALIEELRNAGAHLLRDRGRRAAFTGSLAFVVLLAVAASFSVWATNRPSTAAPGKSVGAINVRRSDLGSGWQAVSDAPLENLVGAPGVQPVSSVTTTTSPNNVGDEIWSTASSNFERCMGVTASSDRMFGSAGQEPNETISSDVLGTSAFGTTEIASSIQYYATTTMVDRDVAEYGRATFGRCWGQVNAQILSGAETDSVTAAKQGYLTTSFTPYTLSPWFRRGGVATLPATTGPNLTLVSLFAAHGHYELYVYVLTGNWKAAQPTVDAAFGAMLARMGSNGAGQAT